VRLQLGGLIGWVDVLLFLAFCCCFHHSRAFIVGFAIRVVLADMLEHDVSIFAGQATAERTTQRLDDAGRICSKFSCLCGPPAELYS